MRIIQTIAGTRLDHGGTSRSVPALCDALVKLGLDNHLVTAIPADPSIASSFPLDRSRVHLAVESPRLRQLGVGRQFRKILQHLVGNDPRHVIVHDHAVWLPSNHAVAKYCRRVGVRRVVSPRGMLGEWALGFGKWKKRLAWNLYQRADLESVAAFHATSEQEAEEIRALGYKQPIAVIPNGISIPEKLPERRRGNPRQVLFLSRIHPKKGLLNLVRAWKQANVADGWRLVIAGPDEDGHQQSVEQEVARLELRNVDFAGSIADEDKWKWYAGADLFVLPSFNENFGIVIAEAMATGLPVITTTGTPWSVLRDRQMGWWVEPSVEALRQAIVDATSQCPETLAIMGRRAEAHVRECYSWSSVAENVKLLYQWLIEGGNVPTCVHVA